MKRILSRRARQRVRNQAIFRGIFDKEGWTNDKRGSVRNSKNETKIQGGGVTITYSSQRSHHNQR